jgi:hypothetical protein
MNGLNKDSRTYKSVGRNMERKEEYSAYKSNLVRKYNDFINICNCTEFHVILTT